MQAKFYNENFPLVYESDNVGDSLYEEHGATLKHKCGKKIVTLPLLSFSLFFLFFCWASLVSFIFLWASLASFFFVKSEDSSQLVRES